MNANYYSEIVLAVLLMLAVDGCRSNDTSPPAAPSAPPKDQGPPAKPQAKPGDPQQSESRKYGGPPVSVQLLQQPTYPPHNVVAIEVTAPSGGWTLALDKGEVINNAVKVYLTLEKPAEGEVVTQAQQRLSRSFTIAKDFAKAEVWIHQAQRGVQTLTTDYRLALVKNVDEPPPPPPPSPADSGGAAEPGGLPGTSPPSPGGTGGAGGAKPEDRAYAGPPVTVEIIQAKRLPPIPVAVVRVTAPTGGWTLTMDKTEIVGDTARLYLTLEGPAPGELVTQALMTLTEQFESDKPPFTKAQVFIHLAQRDVQTLTTDYRLAATAR